MPSTSRSKSCGRVWTSYREIGVLCRSGQRAYSATRILLQRGFDARVLPGGMLWHAMRP